MPLLRLILALSILISTPAWAGASSWIMTQKSGDVRVSRGGLQPASVKLQSSLEPGDVITTGADGRAMLTRGNDYVVVAPQSRLLLPAEQQSGFTRLVQQLGTMFYKVKPTGKPNFSVDAPMLAAVVKGTSFTVIVEANRELVQVTEGIVEVTTASGTARQLVHGGKTVMVNRDRPNELVQVEADKAILPASGGGKTVQIEAKGEIPLAEVVRLTGGLVREDPKVPAALSPVATPAAVPALVAPGAKASPAAPVTETVTAAVRPTTAPAVTVPSTATPSISTPSVSVPSVTVPSVTVPGVSAPSNPAVPTAPSASVPTAPPVAVPSIPTAPTAPIAPAVPTAPTVPSVPTVPTAPTVPTVPPVPTAPTMPATPTVPPPPGG